SGVAYVLNFRIVAAAGASTASSVTYLTPVVAAVVGVSVLGEHVRWNQPVGAVVVLIGIAVSQGLHRAVAARIARSDSSRSSG
ncbi:EamA family transporter, partial [Quadrisphaera oryzae]